MTYHALGRCSRTTVLQGESWQATTFVINIGTPSHLCNCQEQFYEKTPPPCTVLIFPSEINLPVTQHYLKGGGGVGFF